MTLSPIVRPRPRTAASTQRCERLKKRWPRAERVQIGAPPVEAALVNEPVRQKKVRIRGFGAGLEQRWRADREWLDIQKAGCLEPHTRYRAPGDCEIGIAKHRTWRIRRQRISRLTPMATSVSSLRSGISHLDARSESTSRATVPRPPPRLSRLVPSSRPDSDSATVRANMLPSPVSTIWRGWRSNRATPSSASRFRT
jgi:hypothetical protein